VDVSVIIPTYNRKESVLRTLNSLAEQTLNTDHYEVIVVDDGSPDDTASIAKMDFPFAFHYLQQENQGATIARNYGVSKSQADILVFIDDDVTVSPQTLEALAGECNKNPKTLVMGTLHTVNVDNSSVYTQQFMNSLSHKAHTNGHKEHTAIHFSKCNTELLAVKRKDFFEIGMLQDPTNGQGWPNWDDVDFGYRSYLKGFQLLQSHEAIGQHWDYSISDWLTACRRWQRASKSAVYLFKAHPGLQPHIPMLQDKAPVVWKEDPPLLIIKKLARYITSSDIMLAGLGKITNLLEKHYPSPTILGRLYRWLGGGYMFKGYREGLRELGPIDQQNEAV